MTILKKHIDMYFSTSYVIIEDFVTKNLIKIKFNYLNKGNYETIVYIATKPQNKLKFWKQIAYKTTNEDRFNSIDDMLKNVAFECLGTYRKQKEIEEKRDKKWKEFIKNT